MHQISAQQVWVRVTWAEGAGRRWVALGLLAAVAGVAWLTMEPGRMRWLVVALMAGFALRVLLARGPRLDGRGVGGASLDPEADRGERLADEGIRVPVGGEERPPEQG